MTPKPQKIEGEMNNRIDEIKHDIYPKYIANPSCPENMVYGIKEESFRMTKPQKIEGEWEKRIKIIEGVEGGCWVYINDDCINLSDDKKPLVDFISSLLASERQRCVEEAVKYMKGRSIDMPVGSPTPVIVTEHLAKLELLEQLK